MRNEELIDFKKMEKKLQSEVEFTTRKLVFRNNDSQKHCFVIQ
jgi:hypothetical protein